MKQVMLFVISVCLFSCSSEVESTKPAYRKIVESVYASGTIRPMNDYDLYTSIPGILNSWLVEEGDTISVGSPIAIIESESRTLDADNAKLAYEQALVNASPSSAILTELKLQAENAKRTYQLDSTNYGRLKELQKNKIGTKAELDNSQLRVTTSLNNYQSAKKRLELRNRQLSTDVSTAQNLLSISNNNKTDLLLRSKIDGRVYATYKEAGEFCNSQQALAYLGSGDSYIIELLIDELDINRVELGQKVLLTIDSYGTKVFEASISKIYPVLDPRTQTIMVEAEFKDKQTRPYPGSTIEANIVIKEKGKALTIPKKYLTKGDSVFISSDKKKELSVGLQNMEYVEVLSGLDSSTIIYQPSTK